MPLPPRLLQAAQDQRSAAQVVRYPCRLQLARDYSEQERGRRAARMARRWQPLLLLLLLLGLLDTSRPVDVRLGTRAALQGQPCDETDPDEGKWACRIARPGRAREGDLRFSYSVVEGEGEVQAPLLRVRVESDKVRQGGWLAWGVSPDGTMRGWAIVGGLDRSPPVRFDLNGYKSRDVTESPPDKQDVLNPKVAQMANGALAMEFLVRLTHGSADKEEREDLPIFYGNGKSTHIIWAHGSGERLGYHDACGSFPIQIPEVANVGVVHDILGEL